MTLSPTPRGSPRVSRLGLALATLAASGTFAAAVAIAGLPAAPVADASVSAPATAQVVTDPATGERVIVDTVYIVTPPPAADAAPVAAPTDRHEGDDEHEGGEDHESEGGDD
jgi:hypothetical protein